MNAPASLGDPARPVAAPTGDPARRNPAAAAGDLARALVRGHPAVAALAATGVLAEIGYPLAHGDARAVLTAAAVLACCAAVLTHAAATRGRRTAIAAAAVFGAGGWLVEALGVHTGVPFGAYRYGTALGPAVAGVPLLVGCAWCMTAWPAYLVGHRLSARRATLLAAAALASWDLFLDPQLVAAGYWTWLHPTPALPGLPGVPLTNYAGWLLTATILMAGFTGAAGRSARTSRPVRTDAVPLALYLWTYGSSVLAHAAFLGLPGSALWGGAGMGLVAVPLVVRLARR